MIGPHIGFGGSRDQSIQIARRMGGKYVVVLNDAELCKQLLLEGFIPIFRIKDGHWDDDNAHQHFSARAYITEAHRRLHDHGAEAALIYWNNEPGEWDLPVLKAQLHEALETAEDLGVTLVVLNIAYRNWTMSVWDALALELAMVREAGHFVGIHEGYHRDFPDIQTAVPECIGRFLPVQARFGVKFIVTEFAASWAPDYGWRKWLSVSQWIKLISDAMKQVYHPAGVPICIFTVYPWAHDFDYFSEITLQDEIGRMNREFPMATIYDMADYIVPEGKPYALGGVHGSSGFEIVQSLRSKNALFKNNTLERIWFDNQFIYRGIDTSAIAQDEVYSQFTGSRYGAVWCKRFMKVGDVSDRAPDVVHYRANGEIKHRDTAIFSQLKLDSYVSSKTFQETGVTVSDVIELHWVMGGKIIERYWYAKGIGLVGFGAEGIPGGYHSRIAVLNETRTPNYGIIPVWFVEPNPLPVQGQVLEDMCVARMSQAGVRVRAEPNGTILKTTQLGEQIRVAKPIPAIILNGYTWYHVATGDGIVGWSANPIGGVASWTFLPAQDEVTLDLRLIYVSQIDNNANLRNNDCGIACALSASLTKLMRVGYGKMPILTINNLLPLSPLKSSDSPLSLAAVSDFLKLLNVDNVRTTGLTPAAIRDALRSGKTVMPLINYKVFGTNERIGHYVLVSGLTKNGGFVVNDPYKRGEAWQLTEAQVVDGMTDVSAFSGTPNVGLIISL